MRTEHICPLHLPNNDLMAASSAVLPESNRPAVVYYPIGLPYLSTPVERAWKVAKASEDTRSDEHRYVKARRGHDFVSMIAVFRAPTKSSAELNSSATFLHDGSVSLNRPLLRKFDKPTADRLAHEHFVEIIREVMRNLTLTHG